MRVSISGSTGLTGTELRETFSDKGMVFKIINKDSLKMTEEEFIESKIEGADAVINLAGAAIFRRWNPAYKREIYASRIETTRKIANAIVKSATKPRVFVSVSAIGIYDSSAVHNEQSHAFAETFLGKLCRDWESEAIAAAEATRVVILRTGIILSSKGGAMKEAYGPFRFGLGGTIGKGEQAFSWIHIRDLMHVYQEVLENETLTGVVNAVAPNPTTNYHFTKTFGKVLNQITVLHVPVPLLKLRYGEAAETLTEGQSVIPEKLLTAGFQFEFPTIEKALLNLYRI